MLQTLYNDNCLRTQLQRLLCSHMSNYCWPWQCARVALVHHVSLQHARMYTHNATYNWIFAQFNYIVYRNSDNCNKNNNINNKQLYNRNKMIRQQLYSCNSIEASTQTGCKLLQVNGSKQQLTANFAVCFVFVRFLFWSRSSGRNACFRWPFVYLHTCAHICNCKLSVVAGIKSGIR